MDKKNIVIVIIDALRLKNLSLFGYHKETDKNIKSIAKASVIFQNHFSSSNSTAPSVTSILTGLYPHNHGILHQLPYTKPEEIRKFSRTNHFWFPGFLKEQGYGTICIDWVGLWFKKDFDYYGEGEEKPDYVKPLAPFRSAKEITNLAIEKIDQSKKPFFLFLHFWDTHFPFPHVNYHEQGGEQELNQLLSQVKNLLQREYLKGKLEGNDLYTIEGIIKKYDLSIESVDDQIGKLYDFLKSKGLWEDTIFVLMGDHGTNLTEHGIYFSSSGLYDPSIHTPLIMRFPGLNGKSVQEFVQNIDVIPTILDYLELRTDKEFDGKSLLELIKNGLSIRKDVLSIDGLCEDIKSIRTKEMKIILAENNFCNLCKSNHHESVEEYDLKKDPEEFNNIYTKKSL